MHAYEGLTRYDAKYEVEPCLATKWTYVSPDAGALRAAPGRQVPGRLAVHRRRRLFSFGRIRQPQGTMQIYVTGIADIKKVDDYTIDVVLSAPQPDPAAQHHRLPHHEQGLGGEEQHHQRTGLQSEGGELRVAQRQWAPARTRS